MTLSPPAPFDNTVAVTVTAPVFAYAKAATILLTGLDRGYWDDEEDFDALASRAAGLFDPAWDGTNGDEPHSVTLPFCDFDTLVGVLVCDAAAETTLRPLVEAIDEALDSAENAAGIS